MESIRYSMNYENCSLKSQHICPKPPEDKHPGGLLRRANNLARGALIAAKREKGKVVSAEHVRIASTEII
jgi:hypothetical protein